MENELPNYEDFLSLTESQRSLLILEKLRTIIINQTNHLKHSWALAFVCIAAGLAGMFNLGIAMIILFFRT